jgi:hypothetical protein
VNAERAEKYLKREVGDSKLRVRWRNDIERFEVGRLTSALASDHIEWFYIVSDGNDGFRTIDMRTVRKLISLDTWRRAKHLTVEDFTKQIEDRQATELEAQREVRRYRLKHEARYIKKAAEKDGII